MCTSCILNRRLCCKRYLTLKFIYMHSNFDSCTRFQAFVNIFDNLKTVFNFNLLLIFVAFERDTYISRIKSVGIFSSIVVVIKKAFVTLGVP